MKSCREKGCQQAAEESCARRRKSKFSLQANKFMWDNGLEEVFKNIQLILILYITILETMWAIITLTISNMVQAASIANGTRNANY